MTGEEMKVVRKALGLSQAAFGERIGKTEGFIGEMERGEKRVEKTTGMAVDLLVLRGQLTALHAGLLEVGASIQDHLGAE